MTMPPPAAAVSSLPSGILVVLGKVRCGWGMVQRNAALLALSTQLGKLYSAASENAFTAVELDIER